MNWASIPTPFATPSRANASTALKPLGSSIVDPYIEFIRHTLDQHPRLARHAHLPDDSRPRLQRQRRAVAAYRCPLASAVSANRSCNSKTFPGEQAQVDWAHFGHVMVGRARRALSCFVMTLSYSRALYLEFFFDQTMENFLRGHVHAFESWPGQPRVILYDNLKSAVLERRGNQIQFHPA